MRNMKLSKNKILLAILILALCLGGIYIKFRNKDENGFSTHAVQVKKRDINLTVLSTGTVQPENRLEIKPPVAGRIERVLVDEGKKVHKGEVLAWMSSTERAALLDAAQAHGAEQVKKWEELYKPTPILAPLNGTIIARNVESGQTVVATDASLVMSDRLTVKAQVDETDLAQVKLKQKAVIILDAYPAEEIPAKVDKIAYEATTTNNVTNYVVDVLPDKTPDFMRSGMTANVTFLIDEKKDVLSIPSEAITPKDGKNFVKMGKADEPTEKEITIGASNGKFTEVTEGLQEGDTVLIVRLKAKEKTSGSSPLGMPKGPNNRRGGGGK